VFKYIPAGGRTINRTRSDAKGFRNGYTCLEYRGETDDDAP